MTTLNLRGASLDVEGVVGDDMAIILDVSESGAEKDLSGYTISAVVARPGGATVATFSSAVSGSSNEILTLTLTDTQTTSIGNERNLTWSLRMTASGSTKQWVAGDFELKTAGEPGASTTNTASLTYYEDGSPVSLAVTGVSGAGGVTSLGDLSDVTITSSASGDILRHNGSAYVDVPGTDYFAARAPVATTQSGTTYTIDADDHNTTVILSNAAQVTVTIPTDASDDLIDGYRVMLFSSGAGGVTLSTSGITLVGSSPNTTISQNEGMYLEKTGTANTWIVVGATAA